MATNVTMPQLGESVTEGTVGKWLKQKGDKVAKYEPLVEIITDKVNSEIPSPAEGTLLDVLVPEGETIKVGTLMAVIGALGEAASGAPAAAKAPEAAPTTPARQTAPNAGQATPTLPQERAASRPHPNPPPLAGEGATTPSQPVPVERDRSKAARLSPVVARLAA